MKILVSGGAGQIAYSLIPFLLTGSIFGKIKIDLILLDIEMCIEKLQGVKMEIEDSNFELISILIVYAKIWLISKI